MTGLLLFFGHSTNQVVVALILSVVSIVVYMSCRPFEKDDDDDLANACQLGIFFTIFGALLIHVRVDEKDGYDHTVFGVLFVIVNLFGPSLIFLNVAGTSIKLVFRLFVEKQRHNGTLIGPTDAHKTEQSFVDYFEELALSDAATSGFCCISPSGDERISWFRKTGAKLELRNNQGYGPINEGRISFLVDQSVDKVCEHLLNNDFDQREGFDQIFKLGESTETKRILFSCEKKLPFPFRSKDRLIEEFTHDTKARGGKLIVSRSIIDDSLFSLKQTRLLGYRRVNFPLRGFLMRKFDEDDTLTQVVCICTIDLNSVVAEVSGPLSIPRALRKEVDALLKFSEDNKLLLTITAGKRLSGIIGVPMPPSDWGGYNEKKYQSTRKEMEEERKIINAFEMQRRGGGELVPQSRVREGNFSNEKSTGKVTFGVVYGNEVDAVEKPFTLTNPMSKIGKR